MHKPHYLRHVTSESSGHVVSFQPPEHVQRERSRSVAEGAERAERAERAEGAEGAERALGSADHTAVRCLHRLGYLRQH